MFVLLIRVMNTHNLGVLNYVHGCSAAKAGIFGASDVFQVAHIITSRKQSKHMPVTKISERKAKC